MITGNVNLRSNIVATTIGSAAVTRGGGGFTPTDREQNTQIIGLEISGNQNRCKEYQATLHSYSLQLGIKDTISIQQLLATLEWLVL